MPEPKRDRNRVLLEVAVAPEARSDALAHLLALGAKRRGDQFVDVEGNEFTLVAEEGSAERRLGHVVFDALDPDRLVQFWTQATGYEAHEGRCEPTDTGLSYEQGQFRLGGQAYLHVTAMDAQPATTRLFDLAPGIAFARTNRAKGHKNRLHLDLTSTDAEADRERLVTLGATVLRWNSEHVLADPEGNEFCLSPSQSPG